jgi:hypothetical protein
MEQVYDQYKYLPEMREAVKLWERHLEEKVLCCTA